MILNIEQSAQLYNLMSPYLPIETEDVIDFSDTILYKIVEAGKHETFMHIAMLLTGKKMEELIVIEDMQGFMVELMECMLENSIFELIDFYRGFNG